MNLKLIPHLTCPECGARTVAESCHTIHVNGQGFEHREFACGCKLSYVPNFHQLQTSTPCPNSPAQKKLEARRRVAHEELMRFIATLDLTDEDKELVKTGWRPGFKANWGFKTDWQVKEAK